MSKENGTIQTILWDIDGTLLNFEKAERAALHACFGVFGLGVCSDEMLRHYSAINRGYWQRLERGELSKREALEGRFYDFFCAEGIDPALAGPFNLEYQARLGDTVFFQDRGDELVRSLRGRVRQYAVTNGTKTAQQRKLKNSGLDQMLDGVFISDEIGFEKPQKGFFDHVFARIERVSKQEIMIVGDSLTSDMLGGNRAGIRCCWYNPGRLLAAEGLHIDHEITNLWQVLEVL